MKKLILVKLIFILISFSCATGNEDDNSKQFCTELDRTTTICPGIQDQVCGYKKDNSFKNFENFCYACLDKNIIFFKYGSCKIKR